ncbi:alpha/beta hydrolase family protein [Pseudomaricurvus sp.]|uniref:alpha/beta hydrolase family protein n=1 Tax=Pseudomaricurvus sp. TaxID=2004510 RepID=UPI003F6BE6F4
MNMQAVVPEPDTINPTEHSIITESGRSVQAKLFEAHNPKSVVIIAGAMGVAQRAYEKFARFLAQQGHTAITFDYFGSGLSLQTPLKDCDADLRSWGEQDCEAVIEYAHQTYPNVPLQWIGHSVGGQLLGIMRNSDKLNKAITMASGTGYWRYNAPKTRRVVWVMWYVVAPLSVAICGYFPGKKLKMVGDLPANVMRQWRRWCLVKDYAAGAEGPEIRQRYADVNIPIISISFSDDDMLSSKNINSLHQFFNQKHVSMVRINPKEIGERSIGHLGWFRDKYKESLWQGAILPKLDSGLS